MRRAVGAEEEGRLSARRSRPAEGRDPADEKRGRRRDQRRRKWRSDRAQRPSCVHRQGRRARQLQSGGGCLSGGAACGAQCVAPVGPGDADAVPSKWLREGAAARCPRRQQVAAGRARCFEGQSEPSARLRAAARMQHGCRLRLAKG